MRLVHVCEPFFAYVCTLSRASRRGARLDAQQVLLRLQQLLAEIRAETDSSNQLSAAYTEEVEWALIAHADYTIRSSSLPFAGAWSEMGLGPSRGHFALDDEFWVSVEAAMADGGAAAQHQIEVFLRCVELGFEGGYRGEEDIIHAKAKSMRRLAPGALERKHTDVLCPDAKKHTDKRPISIKLTPGLSKLTLALLVMIAASIFANVLAYRHAVKDLQRHVDEASEAINDDPNTAPDPQGVAP